MLSLLTPRISAIDLNSNHLCSTRSAKSHYTSFHRSGGSEVVKGKKVLNDIQVIQFKQLTAKASNRFKSDREIVLVNYFETDL